MVVYVKGTPVDPPLGWWVYWEDGVGILRMSSDDDTVAMSSFADADHVSTHPTMISAAAEIIANIRK